MANSRSRKQRIRERMERTVPGVRGPAARNFDAGRPFGPGVLRVATVEYRRPCGVSGFPAPRSSLGILRR